jgi:hypothetical protein
MVERESWICVRRERQQSSRVAKGSKKETQKNNMRNSVVLPLPSPSVSRQSNFQHRPHPINKTSQLNQSGVLWFCGPASACPPCFLRGRAAADTRASEGYFAGAVFIYLFLTAVAPATSPPRLSCLFGAPPCVGPCVWSCAKSRVWDRNEAWCPAKLAAGSVTPTILRPVTYIIERDSNRSRFEDIGGNSKEGKAIILLKII